MTLRLDQAIADRGLAPSRARARDLILRGLVSLDGTIVTKPSTNASETANIEVARDAAAEVSRGAAKLKGAFAVFAVTPKDRVCLDVGASTGGFTQVLLERGAAKVFAVDVGSEQLHPSLRDDDRVVVLEQTDARALTAAEISQPVDAITADLSFISATKALEVPMSFAAPGAWMIVLVKPQFEVGPDAVQSGGIVRDGAARMAAVETVAQWINAQNGWTVRGHVPSPVRGGDGNEEFLVCAKFHG